MKTKFTLGPWNCMRACAGGREIITSDVSPVDICVLSRRDKTPAEINANACLIAAAPDLYGALEECAYVLLTVGCDITAKLAFDALKKARGEQ